MLAEPNQWRPGGLAKSSEPADMIWVNNSISRRLFGRPAARPPAPRWRGRRAARSIRGARAANGREMSYDSGATGDLQAGGLASRAGSSEGPGRRRRAKPAECQVLWQAS